MNLLQQLLHHLFNVQYVYACTIEFEGAYSVSIDKRGMPFIVHKWKRYYLLHNGTFRLHPATWGDWSPLTWSY